MIRTRRTGLLVFAFVPALVLPLACSQSVGEEREDAAKPKVEIGNPLPDFTLKDYEGKEHGLSAHLGKTVVLAFTSQECPYSRAGDPRLAKVVEQYGDKPVVFLSIDSHAATSPAKIKEYATKKNETGKKLPYPILKDEGNAYADVVGAKRTPEIYIVDKDGKLAYHGALDNQKKPEDKNYESYVAKALDEVLAGKPVSKPKTGAYGCGIKRVETKPNGPVRAGT